MTASHEPVDPRPETDPNAHPKGDAPDFVDAPADAAEDPIALLQAQLDAALAEVAEQKEAVLRARADTENVRRRAQEDVSKAHKFGIESFAESMVPVKDSLEAALAQADQTLDTLREGVEVTLKQVSSAFERNRLTEVQPAQGDKFDPHKHQAISSVPGDQPANTIVQTLQKGYMISDRVLRPALVIVSAGKA
ncbi:nucleotide exchange factor GrpE [Alcaligenaceae bacterium A4P071]|uniref:nucleotide exchange factor GrpE n=1 Tax=Schauerella aestuarii TaxID=2511204 RepID=UPI00136AF752|nr:nucleotide exchange factor GrpE [Achromobacter aestuarii]MDQ2139465.1 nucleotide exchange factor GrpE [Alcaligenaceae bacterium B3P038]MDQ2150477.1 nucleotide exchange factor GrpE [Alcaligenaceae bacterium C4P045]MDQ2186839.1 nucleotide exchange factor GrpE [Alcaligenaceae bacterium A4P071]MYZ42971.1 nucleotide exchange factor GrpE [Achromobacter aestuarii]